ncbi:MAG: amidophosphoribosyltransferase [bacterium]
MIDITKLKRKESLKDKCGVFGIYGKNEDVARISYFGLYSLQHRGQEGAGLAVSNGERIKTIKGLGLVPSVFSEKNIASLKGYIAIGHTRYSTTGGNTHSNVQPVHIHFKNEDFTLAHNGNLINAGALIKTLPPTVKMKSTTDTEVMGWVIRSAKGKSWEEKITNAMPQFSGAYSIVAMTKTKLFAFRDPNGFRPLVLGKLNGGYVVCSETCALDTTGARFIRNVKPGEVISIDQEGLHEMGKVKRGNKSFCIFEYVYFARPDSILNKELVHQVRQRSGELLAHEAPVGADLVVAIPDSGTSAAIGYSKASGIPFGEILIKNRYIGRTFIQPEQRIRDMGVKMKFNPLKQIVKGKRIIIVDDSIVRGTTIKRINELLRKCGVKKIHVRVCSPPVTHSCYFGVDTADRKKLIASEMSIDQTKKYINADSLAYLSLSGLVQAARQKTNSLCAACFTGKYSIPIDNTFSKLMLEKQQKC